MKWTLTPMIILVVVAVTVVLTSCGSDPKPLTLTKDADGTSVQVEVGQALEISLEGNPTTGYSWEVKETGEPTLKPQGEPAYIQAETGATLVGEAARTRSGTWGSKPGPRRSN